MYGFLINSYDGLYEAAVMDATTKLEGAFTLSPVGGVSGYINLSQEYPNVTASTHAVTVRALDGENKALPNVRLIQDGTTCYIRVTANTFAGPGTANILRFILLRLV